MKTKQELLESRIKSLSESDFHRSLKISEKGYRDSITRPSFNVSDTESQYPIALIDPRLTIRQTINKVNCKVVDLIVLKGLLNTVNIPNKPYWIPVRLDQKTKGDSVYEIRKNVIGGWRGLTLQEALFCNIEGLTGFDNKEDWGEYLLLGSSYTMGDTLYRHLLDERYKSKVEWSGAPLIGYKLSRPSWRIESGSIWLSYVWFSARINEEKYITPLTKL